MTSPAADLIVTDISELVTLRGDGKPRTGEALRDIGIVKDGALAALGGRIVAAGARDEVLRAVKPAADCRAVSAQGSVVMPGFVDCHTHLVFARYRLDEYEWRVAGTPYAEIAARGGGIAKSVSHVRSMTESELLAVSRRRLHSAIAHGTTTIEIKSGYGLDLEHEMKQLRVVRALAESHPVTIVPTFLGAHAIPSEYREKREDYVRLLTDVMIPAVVRENLAEFNDVFCETGAFSREETERILRSGQRAGLKARIHAEELTDTGGAVLAAEIGAASAGARNVVGGHAARHRNRFQSGQLDVRVDADDDQHRVLAHALFSSRSYRDGDVQPCVRARA
jgi:imidazolonepropionase